MFATSARARPCSARVGLRSSLAREARPRRSSTSHRDRRRARGSASVPFGPFTRMRAVRAAPRVTPVGIAIGSLADARHRYQTSQSSSPPSVLLARLAVGEHAARRREHRDAEPVAHARDLAPCRRRRGGPGGSRGGCRRSAGGRPRRSGAGCASTALPSRASTSHRVEEALRRRARCATASFSFEDGHAISRVARLPRVADAGQHVGDGIGHHGLVVPLTAGTACRGGRAAPSPRRPSAAVVQTVTFMPVIFSTLS